MSLNNNIKTDNRFILNQDKTLPKCIITDFDGTISLMNGRVAYDYHKVDTDLPNQNVISILHSLSVFNKVFIFTGREDYCRDLCISWLDKHNIDYSKLIMRKTGDFRNDAIIKKEMYLEHIQNKYNVSAWFDDRNKVVDMVRKELGLLCLQVYYGDF